MSQMHTIHFDCSHPHSSSNSPPLSPSIPSQPDFYFSICIFILVITYRIIQLSPFSMHFLSVPGQQIPCPDSGASGTLCSSFQSSSINASTFFSLWEPLPAHLSPQCLFIIAVSNCTLILTLPTIILGILHPAGYKWHSILKQFLSNALHRLNKQQVSLQLFLPLYFSKNYPGKLRLFKLNQIFDYYFCSFGQRGLDCCHMQPQDSEKPTFHLAHNCL